MKNANPVCAAWQMGVLVLAAALALTACQKSDSAAQPKTGTDRFAISVGGKVTQLQLAVTPPEMERGLMERRNLGPDEGMLFIYPRSQRMSFWMRNTPTPLDIAFFNAAGVLQEIYPMQPFDESGLQSRGASMAMALEMNQGWFREHGLGPGAQLDVKALRAALEARGFDPARYAIGR